MKHASADEAGGSWRTQKQNSGKAHRQLHPCLATLDGRRSGGKDVQGAIKKDGVQLILAGTVAIASDRETLPADSAPAGRKLANGPELFTVAKSQIAHVAVKLANSTGSSSPPLATSPRRGGERRIGAFTTERTDHMNRPCDALVEPTLNREGARTGLVGQLQQHSGRRLGQNEGFANLKVLDDERTSFEQLHARLERDFHERRCRENGKVFDPMILEKGHVTAVESRDPGGSGARQSRVEQPSAAWLPDDPRANRWASFHQRLLSQA